MRPAVGAAAGEAEIVIRPASERLRFSFTEYYRYRHLFAALVRRNIRAQFDAMRLGLLWAGVRPLLYVLVFVALRRLSDANTYVTIPYPLYVYSGLILWYYFIEAVMESTSALKRDADLLTKVYYPRLLTPAVPIVANLFNLSLAALPMLGMMAWYGIYPSWRILLLPLVLLQCLILIMGVGSAFASLALTNRDWERFLSSLLYLGLFVSPVIYAPGMIPDRVQPIYFLNPMAGTLLAFRSALFAPELFPLIQWLFSCVFSVLMLVIGARIFRAAESTVADQL